MVMTRKQLLRAIDSRRVEAAIQNAERQTSGEIVVSVAPFFWGSIPKAAKLTFTRLGVSRTSARNGVLFFIVPSRRQFVVLGDQGIHEKVGQEFWELVASHLTEHFHIGEFTEGLVNGIEEVGRQLATYFPYDRLADANELADDIDFGSPE
ncbi:MAG TPA: TPM domain-containing protein [Terriglobia bacterium]|nr:TPM domain-containing protein [Terriglobia bacterium]